jgi:hypothetical protein
MSGMPMERRPSHPQMRTEQQYWEMWHEVDRSRSYMYWRLVTGRNNLQHEFQCLERCNWHSSQRMGRDCRMPGSNPQLHQPRADESYSSHSDKASSWELNFLQESSFESMKLNGFQLRLRLSYKVPVRE